MKKSQTPWERPKGPDDRIQGLIRVNTEMYPHGIKNSRFRDRNLSDRTVNALVENGIEFPEELLFMSEKEIKAIRGIGKASLMEILNYKSKHASSDK